MFTENDQFDNLVDYNHYQYSHIEEVIKSEFSFEVTLDIVNTQKLKNHKSGRYKLSYEDKQLSVSNKDETLQFEVYNIKFVVI